MSRIATSGALFVALSLAATAQADMSQETIDALGAPDSVETPAGLLEFRDGAPTAETAQRVFDTLDFTRALNVYNNSFRGASALGLQKGLESNGAGFNDVTIFSALMDSSALFLTANADTVYYMSVIDLSEGPMVIEQPSNAVGTINDMWFSWVVDIGGPGPDRGQGGKYLLVGPGHDGPLPEGGYFVAHSKTNRVLYAARAYLVNDDPEPAVANVKATMKIYPYAEGAFGTSIAQALTGAVRLGQEPKIPRDALRRSQRCGVQHHPAQRFRFFRMDQRKRPGRTRDQL
jgi:hypothetical protein